MSETLQFSSIEIRSWLESQTNYILTPVQSQARKLRDDLNLAVQGVAEVSKSLLDNSAKEIERRNMRVYNRARALNKLARLFIDRLKKLVAPDQITYESLNKYAQDAQKVNLVTDIDLKNWFPRLSPFFIMDRRRFLAVHEKAKLSLATLNDFLTKEYVKTKTLEETFQLINDLHSLEAQQVQIETDRSNLQDERIPIEKEMAEIEQKMMRLQNKGPVEELMKVEAEKEKLNNELKHALRHLQKPFIKVQALSLHGGGAGLTPDELVKLDQYLEKPFVALATEEFGYPLLKQIMEKLNRLLVEDKLKLKPDKARKAEQTLNDILNRNMLTEIHTKCVEAAMRERQLTRSSEMEEVKSNLSAMKEKSEQLKIRKENVESHEAVKEHAYKDTLERIANTKKAIEKNVYNSLSQKIKIL